MTKKTAKMVAPKKLLFQLQEHFVHVLSYKKVLLSHRII